MSSYEKIRLTIEIERKRDRRIKIEKAGKVYTIYIGIQYSRGRVRGGESKWDLQLYIYCTVHTSTW